MTSLRQISLSPSVLKPPAGEEIPKKPATPWVQYFQAKMPEFKKSYPDMRQPDIMRKIRYVGCAAAEVLTIVSFQ